MDTVYGKYVGLFRRALVRQVLATYGSVLRFGGWEMVACVLVGTGRNACPTGWMAAMGPKLLKQHELAISVKVEVSYYWIAQLRPAPWFTLIGRAAEALFSCFATFPPIAGDEFSSR